MRQWNRTADHFDSTLAVPPWVRRNGSTNPLTSSGQITTNTTTGFYPAEYTARSTQGPDQYAAVTITQLHAGTSGGVPSAILLRCPNNATSGTIPGLFIFNAAFRIYTFTSWAGASTTAQTAQVNANGGSNLAIGSRCEFYVLNNTYYALYNGNLIVSWNDSGATASQTGRYGGLAMQYNTDGSASGVMGFDDFVFGDLRPVDVPMPAQAINRPSTY